MANRDSFTDLELAFFRAGDEIERSASEPSDERPTRPLLKRLFRRKPARQ